MNRRDFIKGLFGLVAAGVAAKMPIEEQSKVEPQDEFAPTTTAASGYMAFISYDGTNSMIDNFATQYKALVDVEASATPIVFNTMGGYRAYLTSTRVSAIRTKNGTI